MYQTKLKAEKIALLYMPSVPCFNPSLENC